MDRERTNLSASPVQPAGERALAAPRLPRAVVIAGWLRSVEVRVVLALLLLALVRGLVYVVIVPPWDHYDEPTHFEYAALINNLGRRPLPEETDRSLRFAIARSVHIYAPWRIPKPPVDTGTNPLPDIGIGQATHPPLYYMLASIPVRLTASAPIEVQLYSMRVFSLLLYLVGIVLAAIVIAFAIPYAPELRLAALSIVVGVPPFTRLMTAASNDALVTLVGVFLLLIGIVIIQQGWSVRSLVLLLLGFLLPFVTKRTIFVLSLVPLLAWVLVAPPHWRRRIGIAAGVAAIASVVFLMSMPRGSSYWINVTTGRMQQPSALGAHVGQRSLLLSSANPQDTAGVGQMLSPQGVVTLPREELTVGVWARALNGEVQVYPPSVLGARRSEVQPVTVGTEWQFIKNKVRMPRWVFQVEMRLNPPITAGAVLYDDAVAVFGDYSKVTAPPTVLPDKQIRWGEDQRVNFLTNGSLETVMPIVHLPAAIEGRLQNVLPFGTIDLLMSSLGDWSFIAAAYPGAAFFLFKTFWLIVDSGFSGTAIDRWTLVMLGLAIGSSAGWLLLAFGRRRAGGQQAAIFVDETTRQYRLVLGLCWAAASLAWGVAMVRVHLQPPWPATDYTYPIGRYAYAAFVPTVILLVVGLGALVPRRWRLWLFISLALLFFVYDIHAISNKIWYHYVAQ